MISERQIDTVRAWDRVCERLPDADPAEKIRVLVFAEAAGLGQDEFEAVLDRHDPSRPWGERLVETETLDQTQWHDLKLDGDRIRVWLSRGGLADGEPFAQTVYAEALSNGRWIDLGYFDGRYPMPSMVRELIAQEGSEP